MVSIGFVRASHPSGLGKVAPSSTYTRWGHSPPVVAIALRPLRHRMPPSFPLPYNDVPCCINSSSPTLSSPVGDNGVRWNMTTECHPTRVRVYCVRMYACLWICGCICVYVCVCMCVYACVCMTCILCASVCVWRTYVCVSYVYVPPRKSTAAWGMRFAWWKHTRCAYLYASRRQKEEKKNWMLYYNDSVLPRSLCSSSTIWIADSARESIRIQ